MPPTRARLSTPLPVTPPAPVPTVRLEPSMLVSALSQLQRELTAPLEHLRSDLARRLSESSGPALSELAETCRPETLIQLCDDLVRLTRVFFDRAAVGEHALEPRRDGRLRLSALIDEADRRFAPEAASRGLGWRCRLEGPDTALAADPLWTRQALGRAIDETLSEAGEASEVTVEARSDGASATVRIVTERRSSSLALRLESDEPEHCALGFARSLLERQGGGLKGSDGPSSLLLHLPS